MKHVTDQEFYSPFDENDRRAGLRRLDDLLLALEELNMREAGAMPQALREKLTREGIPVRDETTLTDLIDMVLGSQDQFMLKERRTGRRRRRLSFIPTDEELVSVISRRYSG
ncbi:MAG TPA: hypothetical protein VGR61_11605 [Candidatus Dormibacteraeota bacterium]|nr:hypothetical protein [Candidatus Dormibacteraeota bacterium]